MSPAALKVLSFVRDHGDADIGYITKKARSTSAEVATLVTAGYLEVLTRKGGNRVGITSKGHAALHAKHMHGWREK